MTPEPRGSPILKTGTGSSRSVVRLPSSDHGVDHLPLTPPEPEIVLEESGPAKSAAQRPAGDQGSDSVGDELFPCRGSGRQARDIQAMLCRRGNLCTESPLPDPSPVPADSQWRL